MSRFVCQLNDGGNINILADSMKIQDTMVLVYNDGALVAIVELDAIVCAHLSRKG